MAKYINIMKGTHGLQQRALALFTAGLALCTPMGWLLQDWYNGNLAGTNAAFKTWFAIIHLACGIIAIMISANFHDKLDRKEKYELV